MAQSQVQVDEVFCEALQRPAGPQGAAYLSAACGDQVRLRERVDRLLLAHDDAHSFLEAPVAQHAQAAEPAELECRGTRIGPYQLLEVIGEGGMGVVYLAEQLRPVHRQVALKVLKPGLDTRSVIGRFEAERQTLAMMDHPNIAKVLDAGTVGEKDDGGRTTNSGKAARPSHAFGRPYFVMELVPGVPITGYCDARRLSVRERLELMIPVCLAIQHAHQKGIIHRDIKPTNVLV